MAAAAGGGGGAAGANNVFRYLDYGSTRGSEVTYLFLADGKRIFKPDHPLPTYDPTNENLAEPNYYQNDYNPAFITSFLETFEDYDPTFEVLRDDDADNEGGYGWSVYTMIIAFPTDIESLGVTFDPKVPRIEIVYDDSNNDVRVSFINFNEAKIQRIGAMLETVYDETPEEVGPGPTPSNLAEMMANTLKRPPNPLVVFENIEHMAENREKLAYNKFLKLKPNTNLSSKLGVSTPVYKKDIVNLPLDTLRVVKKFLRRKPKKGGARRSTRRRRNTKTRKQTRRRA